MRWNSGDIVSYIEHGDSPGRTAELFPMIRHAQRTTGFFKVRGVNVNHAELEDFMFRNPAVNDFQGVLVTGDDVAAREKVIQLAEAAGMRAWHAGPLANSAAAEALTSVLIHINKRYGSDHASIQINGVPLKSA